MSYYNGKKIITYVSHGGGGASTADAVSYDNTKSGLDAENLQDAVDKVNDAKVDKNTTVNGKKLSSNITLNAGDVEALSNSTLYGNSLELNIDNSTFVITAQLKDQKGNNLGTAQTIDLPLESVVVNGVYDGIGNIILTLKNGNQILISVGDLINGLASEKSVTDIQTNITIIANGNGGFAAGGTAGSKASTTSGGAIGYVARSTTGGAIGYDANADTGGAIGNGTRSTNGGGAVGDTAKVTNGGGSIGNNANADTGGAVGKQAYSTSGGAVGEKSVSTSGGGAIGEGALSGKGFAGGYRARTGTVDDENNPSEAFTEYDAIQLGTGTNENEKTLQIYDDNIYNAKTHTLTVQHILLNGEALEAKIPTIVTLTQAEYDALPTKDENTYYFIKEE